MAALPARILYAVNTNGTNQSLLCWASSTRATCMGIPTYNCMHAAPPAVCCGQVAGLPCSSHINISLADLHWLRAAEGVKFKLATLMYGPGTATRYLSALLCRLADVPTRRHLRSSSTDALLVRPTQFVTIGDRAFPVAAAKLWNELPGDITAAQSLTVSCWAFFRNRC